MSNESRSRSALCVIDIQKDFTKTGGLMNFKDQQIEGLIANVNAAIAHAQEQNIPVIYIRQVYGSFLGKLFSKIVMGGKGVAGTPGAEFDPRVSVVSKNEFTKEKPSAFSNPKFAAFLKEQGIDTLYIAGLDGCMCVNGTIKSAVKQGYKVNVVTDAVISGFVGRWQKLMEGYAKRGISLTWATDF